MIGLPPSIYTTRDANTDSILFASASVQSASIADGAQTGLEISGGTMTLEQWVKFTTSAASAVFVSRWSATSGFFCYNANYNGFARIRFRIADSVGAQDYVEWTHTPTNGAWHHYAFVWDSALTLATGAMKFYLDGVNFTTGFNIITNNGINNVRDLNVPFTVGAFGDAASPIDARMDEVRVWNTARTQPEIAGNMSTQIPGGSAGLQGYWRFNSDPNDQTANNNDLTLNNGPTYSADVPF
jgi:hypothetical protein